MGALLPFLWWEKGKFTLIQQICKERLWCDKHSSGGTALNETDKNTCSYEAYILIAGDRQLANKNSKISASRKWYIENKAGRNDRHASERGVCDLK